MKNNEYDGLEKLIASEDKRRMSVRKLPNFSEESKGSRITANILVQLKAFQDLIIQARLDIGLEPEYGMQYLFVKAPAKVRPKYPKHSLIQVAKGNEQPPLYPNQLKLLDKWTKTIINHFKLTPDWWIPIRLAILVHALYLPGESQPVLLSKPNVDINYTQIYITENISLSELKKHLQKLKPELEKSLMDLPKRPSGNLGDEAYYWGRAISMVGGVSFASQFSDNHWAFIEELLNHKLADIDDLYVPPPDKLQLYYRHFLNYISGPSTNK